MYNDKMIRFFELRKQLMVIEQELESLKPAVAACLRQQKGVAHLDGYDLLLQTYTAWTYSPQVEEMQRVLTETKKHERLEGTATIREKRDMLVLRSRRPEVNVVREKLSEYETWERDDDQGMKG